MAYGTRQRRLISVQRHTVEISQLPGRHQSINVDSVHRPFLAFTANHQASPVDVAQFSIWRIGNRHTGWAAIHSRLQQGLGLPLALKRPGDQGVFNESDHDTIHVVVLCAVGHGAHHERAAVFGTDLNFMKHQRAQHLLRVDC